MNTNVKSIRLMETIQKSGIKQKEFARLTNITPNTLSRFLHGAEISANYLARVSAVFGVSLPYLLGESDVRSENSEVSNSIISANRAQFELKSIELYMTSKGVRIERTIIIDDKHFRSTKRGWLELSSNDEFDDLEMQKLIQDSKKNKPKYIISLEFGENIKNMTYDEYAIWVQGLIQLNNSYIYNGLFNRSSGDTQDDMLSAAIKKWKEI